VDDDPLTRQADDGGMKRAMLTTLAAVMLWTCGDDSPTAGGIPTTAPSTTTSTQAVVTTTGIRSTTTAAVALPAGWTSCTSREGGFSIGHPAGWHTAIGCRFLDPKPLNITPNSDGFTSAVMTSDWETFAAASARQTDDHALVLLKEATTVGSRRAVRYETESTGLGLWDRGTRFYSYVLDRGGRSFEVSTVWFPGTSTAEYQTRKGWVDEATKTVRFL
jgi:hypothetical protein